ncbi:MAG: DUF378 domain-containing protein [Alphaproteobacteria bacterium]|nr:DUF378 domain-containing protein [Alphaproteobacteria bacterium]
MSAPNYLRLIAFILVIIGALNWGLIGINGFDLVSQLFGPMTALSRAIYTLVGISGIYLACTFKRSL